jgi:hypothetical protein
MHTKVQAVAQVVLWTSVAIMVAGVVVDVPRPLVLAACYATLVSSVILVIMWAWNKGK